jgi:hypothetical protein
VQRSGKRSLTRADVARLEAALREDAERDVAAALKVAVLLAAGYSRAEAGRLANLRPRAVSRAIGQLEAIAPAATRYVVD